METMIYASFREMNSMDEFYIYNLKMEKRKV